MAERKLLLCCNPKDQAGLEKKIRHAFENSVTLVSDPAKADLVYAVGNAGTEMERQIQACRDAGLKIVHVNENLVNQETMDQVKRYAVREWER